MRERVRVNGLKKKNRQLWKNFKSKNADGVSITFLLLWIFGDIFNLLGIVLDNLLFTMVTYGI